MGGVIPAGAASGQTLYGQIRSAVDAQVANGSGLEVYNPAHWGNYNVSMPEQSGSGVYIMTVPGYLPAGRYFVIPFLQLGGSPAAGDTPMDILFFDWDGGNIVWLGSGVNLSKINGSALAAANLSVSALAMVAGAAAGMTAIFSTPIAAVLLAVERQRQNTHTDEIGAMDALETFGDHSFDAK